MRQFILTVLSLITLVSTSHGFDPKGTAAALQYVYRLPKVKTLHPPVVILLHGVGSNETDLFSFANNLPDNFLVVSARAPYTRSQGSYAWYDLDLAGGKHVANAEQAEKSRKIILQFISQLKEYHDFDTHHVYLCGFSQGGIMSFSAGLTRPDMIHGIAVLSGRLLNEVKTMIYKGQQLKQLRVFIGHGTEDDVLGFQGATDANAYLNKIGINTTFKKYQIGHTISKEELNDLVHWLSAGM